MIDSYRFGPLSLSPAEKEDTLLKTILTDSGRFVKGGFFAFIALCGVLCGCATMFAPDSDDITFKTEPEGAEIYDGVNLIGKTPLTYSFVRNTF